MTGQFFRANVGIVVVRDDGLVLAFERADKPDQWQLPQGGLDVAEEPYDAAVRELEEETGIPVDRVRLVAEYPEWLAYELPPEHRRDRIGRGQVQRWFLFRFLGADEEIDLARGAGERQEFSAYRWLPFDELAGSTWEVRRPIYRALRREWSALL